MHRPLRTVALLAVSWLAACVAHEAAGDKAAATGDWKRAVADYRRALVQDPNTPGVAEKLRSAEEFAVRQALERAQACSLRHDFPCAVGESDYVLSLRPGDPEAQLLRAEAGRELALQYVDTVVPAARAGDFDGAVSRYEDGRKLSRDPEVLRRSDAAIAEVVVLARAEAGRRRAAQAFDEAIAVLQPLVPFDATLRTEQDAIQADKSRWIDAEYERRAQAGDQAFARRSWAEAATAYEQAEALRSGGRAAPPLQYVRAMAGGEAAIARRDWAEADRAFRFAFSTGLDRDGLATEAIARVEPRTYRFVLRELLVQPLRPNGAPWAGYQSPLLNQLLALATASLGPGEVPPAVVAALQRVPPQNLPDVVVQVRLPDGTLLSTAPARGLHLAFDAEFTLRTNSYDDGRIGVWVRHVGPAPEEVASFDIPVADFVNGRAASLRQQGVLRLAWWVGRDESIAPGVVRNWAAGPPPPAGPPGYGPPVHAPPRQALELRKVEVRFDRRDGYDGGRRDVPDGVVDVLVNGVLVLRTPVAKDDWSPTWRTAGTVLQVAPGDAIDVVLHDVDRRDADLLGSWRFVVSSMPPRSLEFRTANGTRIELEFR